MILRSFFKNVSISKITKLKNSVKTEIENGGIKNAD
jgi:hypothetical protein